MVDERPISNSLISIKRGCDNTEWILTIYDVGEAYSVGLFSRGAAELLSMLIGR
jgi:hypothetical protein